MQQSIWYIYDTCPWLQDLDSELDFCIVAGEAEAIDSLTHITVKQAIQHSDPVFEPQHAKHAIISNKPPSVAPAMAPAPAHTGPQQGFLGAGQSQAAEDEEEREGDAKASMGRRAAAIQQSMRAHENLTLTAALGKAFLCCRTP